MGLTNFQEWALNEYQQNIKLPSSLDVDGLFLFDDKPVTAINVNFVAMGFSHISEEEGRWYALIPGKIELPGRQVIFIEPTKGKFIIVNNHCRTPDNTPSVILTNRPDRTAVEQYRDELRRKIAHAYTHISPHELSRQIEREFAKVKLMHKRKKDEFLYYRLPNNWIYYCTLTVKPTHTKTDPLGDLTPGGEVINIPTLIEKMKRKA